MSRDEMTDKLQTLIRIVFGIESEMLTMRGVENERLHIDAPFPALMIAKGFDGGCRADVVFHGINE